MSVQNVRDAIQRFLHNEDPQVLCIRGAWGTGKTYTWDDVLAKLAQDPKKALTFKTYAKVSLFGLNSIQEIKREIFQASKPVSKIGKEFDPRDIKDIYSTGKSSNLLFKALSVLSDNAMDAAIEAASLLARNQLICIDDLERKGKDLRSVDVLGYISHLRDVRRCGVVLLLNEEELEDKDEFESYLEKVADFYVRFEPTCQEIADIAVPEEDRDVVGDLVRSNAVNLGITNVRVIRKILRLVRDITPLLSEYSFQVTKSATATITLMGWAYLQPEQAPSIAYLAKMHIIPFSDDEETDDEKRWSTQLETYGYLHTDDFDLLLLQGVKNGFFVKSEIDNHAPELHRADVREQIRKEMLSLWKLFRESFISTETELRDKFFETAMRNIESLELSEMLAVQGFLSDFDDARAEKLLDHYVEVHNDNPRAFDLSTFEEFGSQIDPIIRLKLVEARAEKQPDWTPVQILQNLDGFVYSEAIRQKATEMPIADYIAVLKTCEGEQLSEVMSGLRRNLRVVNPSESDHMIMDKAGMALREIAKENRLNFKRAMATGLIQRLEAREAADATQGSCSTSQPHDDM